jgi:formamidopyrimidine-DNA glycosylase
MPELPEVETIVRSLAPRLRGRRVVSAEYLAARALRGTAEPPIIGHIVREVTRHGKFILLRFDHGALAIHLGMTGKLLIDGEPTPYLRAEIVFDQCRLLFDDIRQFGKMAWSTKLPGGPEPFDIDAAEFAAMLRARRAVVKPLLLNQGFVRGLGNIYVDEALFRAGIDPRSIAANVSAARARALHGHIVEILNQAIESGGSSISDYVDADGQRGEFQNAHKVYGRADEPCVKCGRPVQRIVLGQRGTHFCAFCQRR